MGNLARHFALDPAVTFLNHGSFGACPQVVLDAQRELRTRLESEPVLFMARQWEGLVDEVRAVLGTFLGASADDGQDVGRSVRHVAVMITL
jgi:isopenicillin-N epimerase